MGTVTLPASAVLEGACLDDGLPTPPGATSVLWTSVSGPGTVAFLHPASTTTTASFSVAGVYVLRLSATDGALAAGDELTVVVEPTPVPVGVSQSLSPVFAL